MNGYKFKLTPLSGGKVGVSYQGKHGSEVVAFVFSLEGKNWTTLEGLLFEGSLEQIEADINDTFGYFCAMCNEQIYDFDFQGEGACEACLKGVK